MTEPFVFHFTLGDAGHPESMYIADLKHGCSVCGFEQLKRFYHATPLHELGVHTIEKIAGSLPTKLDSTCENCGSQLGLADVQKSVLTFGFPDDSGLLRTFGASNPKFQFVPNFRLDPQQLPGFEPDAALTTFDALTDDLIEDEFDRVLDVKSTIRDLFEEFENDPEGGILYQLSSDTYIAIDTTVSNCDALLDEVDVPLTIASPLHPLAGLGTHENPDTIPGHYCTWLPASIIDAMEAETLVLRFGFDLEAIKTITYRVLDLGRLSYNATDIGIDTVQTPREQSWDKSVTWESVLSRAAITGLTGGDAARLTAEEIVGLLLRVWR